MQVLLVNKTIPVLVDHVEGLLELLDLGLVEHGEDVGGGTLGPLLGGLSLGFFARHFGCFLFFLYLNEQNKQTIEIMRDNICFPIPLISHLKKCTIAYKSSEECLESE